MANFEKLYNFVQCTELLDPYLRLAVVWQKLRCLLCCLHIFLEKSQSVLKDSLVDMPVRWSPFRKGIKRDLLVSRDVCESSSLYTRYKNLLCQMTERSALFLLCMNILQLILFFLSLGLN